MNVRYECVLQLAIADAQRDADGSCSEPVERVATRVSGATVDKLLENQRHLISALRMECAVLADRLERVEK